MYRLPLHVWAERIETVIANRAMRVDCVALMDQQHYYYKQFLCEYKMLINDMLKTRGAKSKVAWQNETRRLQGLRSNSTELRQAYLYDHSYS